MHIVKSIRSADMPGPLALEITHPANRKIAFVTQEGIHLISWQEVAHCTADSNYTRIHLVSGGVLMVSKTLSRVEAALPSRHFMRVHQSHVICLDQIRVIRREEVILGNDATIPLSRAGKNY